MESRIEELKQKYWDGTSTLEEEAELKRYYLEHPSADAQAKYFEALGNAKEASKIEEYPHPGMRPSRRIWMVAAASVIIGSVVLSLVLTNKELPKEDPFLVEDPQQAYEITRNAFMMMSVGLNQGAIATTELKKINKAEELLIKN